MISTNKPIRVYLSYKITGDLDGAHAEAERMKEFLSQFSDVEVLDTMVMNILPKEYKEKAEKEQYGWYIGESIKVLSSADVVCLNPTWKDSNGCHIEVEYSRLNHIPIIKFSDLIAKDNSNVPSEVGFSFAHLLDYYQHNGYNFTVN